jgi:hypothetical protein
LKPSSRPVTHSAVPGHPINRMTPTTMLPTPAAVNQPQPGMGLTVIPNTTRSVPVRNEHNCDHHGECQCTSDWVYRYEESVDCVEHTAEAIQRRARPLSNVERGGGMARAAREQRRDWQHANASHWCPPILRLG